MSGIVASMGPLTGLKVIEIGSLGPGPFGAMMLADMGAEVIRVERPGGTEFGSGSWNTLNRGRRSVAIDLKREGAAELVLRLCEGAEAFIEGFRPGVMERLGLGPDPVLARHPSLVYARMTGFGQAGPLADAPGHDINYIATSGILGSMARAGEKPLMPLNLVGDMGGGGLIMAFGILCAVLEARASGQGQVLDSNMVEGSSVLATSLYGFSHAEPEKRFVDDPGTNFMDGGSHFYDVYACSDGKYMAVGAVEPQFYAELLRILDLDPADTPQWERERWPQLKERVAARFITRSREQWTEAFKGVEACVNPVLTLSEASEDPHNRGREAFVEIEGIRQPSPAPRFSRTPPSTPAAPRLPGADTVEVLRDAGLETGEIAELRAGGVIA